MTGTRPLRGFWMRVLARIVERVARTICLVSWRGEGFDPTHPGPVLFAANHRSMLDTPAFRHVLPRALKKKLVTVGGYDYFEPRGTFLERLGARAYLRFVVDGYGVWMIDRRLGGPGNLAELMKLVHSGRTLLIYPEGTRSRTRALGRFQPGVGIIASQTGIPVVPVAIVGNERVLPPGLFWPRPGKVRIRAGEMMRPLEGEGAEVFTHRVAAAIQSMLSSMEAAG